MVNGMRQTADVVSTYQCPRCTDENKGQNLAAIFLGGRGRKAKATRGTRSPTRGEVTENCLC
ncbi:MAG: hypothetical protein NC218_02160 [Acetobacter sp.]|nr:hypothetical protein [Acetobacter sp.]